MGPASSRDSQLEDQLPDDDGLHIASRASRLVNASQSSTSAAGDLFSGSANDQIVEEVAGSRERAKATCCMSHRIVFHEQL
uniref:Uncharacterized protein n=1 Tax=Trichogramma kaykai TaxID=54128 RepID=A0ABD2WPK4_9HYME